MALHELMGAECHIPDLYAMVLLRCVRDCIIALKSEQCVSGGTYTEVKGWDKRKLTKSDRFDGFRKIFGIIAR